MKTEDCTDQDVVRYILMRPGCRHEGITEIDRNRYEEICDARKKLFKSLAIEDTWDTLLANYVDLESFLLDDSVKSIVYSSHGWGEIHHRLISINRFVSNLLASAVSYFDHVKRNLTEIYGRGSPELQEWEKSVESEKENSIQLRSLWFLRNISQHADIVAKNVSWKHSADKMRNFFQTRTIPYLDLSKIEPNRREEKAILASLRGLEGEVEVKLVIRGAIDSIGATHLILRQIQNRKIEEWQRTIDNAIIYFQTVNQEKETVGLVATGMKGDGTLTGRQDLFREFIEYRKTLERKNFLPCGFSKRFASGELEIKEPPKTSE